MSANKVVATAVFIGFLLFAIYLLIKYRKDLSKSENVLKIVICVIPILVTAVYNFASPPKAPQIFTDPRDSGRITITSSEDVPIYYSTGSPIRGQFIKYWESIPVDDFTTVFAYTRDFFGTSSDTVTHEIIVSDTIPANTPKPTPTSTSTPSPTQQAIRFVDPAFEKMLRAAMNRPTGPIYPSELARYMAITIEGEDLTLHKTEFKIRTSTITEYTGKMETLVDLLHFPVLEVLRIQGQPIDSLAPLSNVTGLKELRLEYGNIVDVEPLSNLTGLTDLRLNHNNITDFSPLASLSNLSILYLDNNDCAKLTPLSNLTGLTDLWLDGNNISDLTPLSGLTRLKELTLNYNSIFDLSPLSGLTELTELGLVDNNITDLSPLSGLTGLTKYI